MVLFHLIFLLCTTIRPNISVLTVFFLLFSHYHSIKLYGPLSFILSFVHDHPRTPFDQELGCSLIYFLYLHTTIRQKYMVLFYLSFILYKTIRAKIRVLIDLFLSCPHGYSTEICGFLIFIISFVHDHSTKT